MTSTGRVLYVRGLSPESAQYEYLSNSIVNILCNGKELVKYEPQSASDLCNRLRDEAFSTIYFRGHGDTDGNWILPNGEVAEMSEILLIFKDITHLVDLYSTCCYSHKWTKYYGNLRVIGSSSNYRPFDKGAGLTNYFLGKQNLDNMLLTLQTLCSKEEYDRFEGKQRLRTQDLHSDAFEAVENCVKHMWSLDISLVKKVPLNRQLKAITDDFAMNGMGVVDPLPKTNGYYFPRGFEDWDAFALFCEALLAIRPDSDVVIHGSSVTGFRFRYKEGKGVWFNEHSDYDVALCNSVLYQEVIEKYSSMEMEGEHTSEITFERNEWFKDEHKQLQDLCGRKVNFLFYKELEGAKRHAGLSLTVVRDVEDGIFTTYITGEQLPFLKCLL